MGSILYWAELPPDLDAQRARWREVLSGDEKAVRSALGRMRRRGVPHGLKPGTGRANAGIFDAVDDLGLGVCDLHAGDRFAVAARVAAAHGFSAREPVEKLAGFLGSGIGTRLDLRGARSVDDLAAGRSAGIDWGLSAWAHEICLSFPVWPYAVEVLGADDIPAELRTLLRRKRLTERLGGPWRARFYAPLRTQAELEAAGADYRAALTERVQELARSSE